MRIRTMVMRIFVFAAFFLIASSKSYSQAISLQQSSIGNARPVVVTMESLRDRYRPLLIFAPLNTSPQLVEQIRLLTGSNELRDRQVLLIPVTGGSEERLGANLGAGSLKMPEIRHLLPKEAAAVRRRFHADKGAFTVVLVGKDGGEKFRTRSPVTIERLDAVIDAMPMRQQEERDGHAK